MEIGWNGSALFYVRHGTGPKTLLLFHGYGQDHAAFNDLISTLSESYTCYAFDLLFHGQSRWGHGEKPLSVDDMKIFFEKFLVHERIERYSIIGYSIGCRFAVALFAALPANVDKIVLAAPDGLIKNSWYSLATGSTLSRAIFKKMIDRPNLFHALVKVAKAMRLVDQKVLRFSELMMKNTERRKTVFYTWVVLRNLRLNPITLSDLAKEYNVVIHVVLGTYDRLIEGKKIEEMFARAGNVDIVYLDSSHLGLIKRLPEALEGIL